MDKSHYTNMWGENLEEQERRRKWLEQVYDNAVKKSEINISATPNMKTSYSKLIDDEGILSEQEIADRTRNSHVLDYQGLYNTFSNYVKYHPQNVNDKYKHAMTNCTAAQNGTGSALAVGFLSGLKELKDVNFGSNSLSESYEDNRANQIGRYLGFKYPNGDCDEMVQRYIKKRY